MKRTLLAVCAVAAAAGLGCATQMDLYRLEDEIARLKKQTRGQNHQNLADVAAELDELRAQIGSLEGRFEVVEHQVGNALEDARAARLAASSAPLPSGEETPLDALAANGASAGAEGAGEIGAAPANGAPGAEVASAQASHGTFEEIHAYRDAYAAWRDDQPRACIDRFGSFLQTYPSSVYADDAAYWLADCYFQEGDFKTAILRFDDVVARYPTGNKAADALYRQGEALLRLGPGYGKAAGKAFQKILKEYPESKRALEAERQLEILGAG